MIKGEIKRISYNKIEKINLNEQEYQKRLHEIKNKWYCNNREGLYRKIMS